MLKKENKESKAGILHCSLIAHCNLLLPCELKLLEDFAEPAFSSQLDYPTKQLIRSTYHPAPDWDETLKEN
jgi:hypothetical protein